jgi:hypothetical protein
MAGVYTALGNLVFPVFMLLAIVASVLGLARLISPSMRDSRVRFVALAIAVALGILGGAVIELLIAGIAAMDTGRPEENYLPLLPYALGAGLLIAGTSIAGYALFTLGEPGRRGALVGCFLGPILLVGAWAGATSLEQGLNDLRYEAEQTEFTEASTEMATVEVRGVEATWTTGPGGAEIIDTLTLTAVVRATSDLELTTATKIAFPRFLLEHPSSWSFATDALPGWPTTLPAGVDVPYELRFESGTEAEIGIGTGLPLAGTWKLTVWLEDVGGKEYAVTTNVVVPRD